MGYTKELLKKETNKTKEMQIIDIRQYTMPSKTYYIIYCEDQDGIKSKIETDKDSILFEFFKKITW